MVAAEAFIYYVGKDLVKAFIESYNQSKSNDKNQKKIKRWIIREDNYEQLSDAISHNCVRVLINCEFGHKYRNSELCDFLYPNLKLKGKNRRVFLRNFQYRLEYLVAIGVMRKGAGNYTISRLGAAFLSEARNRKEYMRAFKQSV